VLAGLIVALADQILGRRQERPAVEIQRQPVSDDARVVEGWFWFPPATEPCFGTLEIRPRDLRLRLRDSASTLRNGFVVIHGEGLRGEPLTLLDAYLTNWQSHNFSHNSEQYRANSVLIGAHVLRADDLRFARARLHVRGLTEWLATPGIPDGVASHTGYRRRRSARSSPLPGRVRREEGGFASGNALATPPLVANNRCPQGRSAAPGRRDR
jgi:hypothetical protein